MPAGAFDAAYGANFQASDEAPSSASFVENDGAFVAHRATNTDGPLRVAFVDGTPTYRGWPAPALTAT